MWQTTDEAYAKQQEGQVGELMASWFGQYPNVTVGGSGLCSPVMTMTIGGLNLVTAARAYAQSKAMDAAYHSHRANKSLTEAGWERREQEWSLQEKLAEKEIVQIQKQIAAADIRIQIGQQELTNHEQQMENAKAVDDHLRSKFTNEELYGWMVGQIADVYFQSYQLAYDTAKRAERAHRFELGLGDSNFIQFGYWDNLKKGLLAGERLSLDLKRLELSYFEKNKREYEITRHISLLMLNPVRLLKLKETGICEFDISELIFDLDFPGQYMRRIKSVGLTIPCITGPYTSVNAKLTLLKNRIRRVTNVSPKYAYVPEDLNRDRFIHNLTGISSIATSSAQNDHGIFELNFRDERYLPFEGAGVISSWRLELPGEFRQFDYDTISDVILHISYTARDGGNGFKKTVSDHVNDTINNWLDEVKATGTGLPRLFSLRHEFPNAFHKLLNQPPGAVQFTEFEIGHQHFPYFMADKELLLADVDNVSIYLKPKGNEQIETSGLSMKINNAEVGEWNLMKDSNLKEAKVLLSGSPFVTWAIDAGIDGLKKEELEDILILIKYTIQPS